MVTIWSSFFPTQISLPEGMSGWLHNLHFSLSWWMLWKLARIRFFLILSHYEFMQHFTSDSWVEHLSLSVKTTRLWEEGPRMRRKEVVSNNKWFLNTGCTRQSNLLTSMYMYWTGSHPFFRVVFTARFDCNSDVVFIIVCMVSLYWRKKKTRFDRSLWQAIAWST